MAGDKWEYRITGRPEFGEWDKLGEAGWELVTAISEARGGFMGGHDRTYIFKRRKA